MNRRSLAALVVLNVALLAALIVTMLSPAPAQAQLGRAAHRYLMIAGHSAERANQSVVYIIDLDTSQMVAGVFNSANNTFDFFAGRTIVNDIRAGLPSR
ncbi:MAG TPA: hypothetical protein VF184_09410 [Phycisphaeraceae bacterium]